jgi:hypothetical protein
VFLQERAAPGQEHVVDDLGQGALGRRDTGQEELVAEWGGRERGDPGLDAGDRPV